VKKKEIIIGIIALVIIAVPLYIFVLQPGNDIHTHLNGDGQLYTCGMHPEIILDEPGNCPICEMELTPIKSNGNTKSSGERKILYWRAPMDPNEIYDAPGKSNMGMDLVPVYDDGANRSGIVTIDPEVQQNMNVKIEVVLSKSLSSEVITNGVLETDETSEYIATTRVNGWIEKLYINYTGQKVRKGDKLMEIYSPELVAAQQELLTALSYNQSVEQTNFKEISESGEELIRNAVRKLQLFNISDSEIEGIIATGKVKTYLTLYAKKSGTVLNKNVREGAKIVPGTELVRIADLSKLWLLADVYEYELSKVHLGSKTDIRFNFMPGKVYSSTVSFIYPTLDPLSRTAKLRIVMDNSSGELKPAMFANITIKGEDLGDRPTISENAILRSGSRDIVILALGNGKFKPVDVKLGTYANGYYQVLKGLNEGNKIVTSAQFLIDSESNLQAAINQFQSGESETEDLKGETQNEKLEMEAEKHDHSSSLVREGIIDVESIDVNNDGKLFECPMDWNVLSDKDGRCPVCNMYLKEFAIDEVKVNLDKYGFEYKK
jgi:Cu(I)/Ag(I) efflux system membrane fusion protein/cobalt-zinc-cadmium efflux system membrane fusion protein